MDLSQNQDLYIWSRLCGWETLTSRPLKCGERCAARTFLVVLICARLVGIVEVSLIAKPLCIFHLEKEQNFAITVDVDRTTVDKRDKSH